MVTIQQQPKTHLCFKRKRKIDEITDGSWTNGGAIQYVTENPNENYNKENIDKNKLQVPAQRHLSQNQYRKLCKNIKFTNWKENEWVDIYSSSYEKMYLCSFFFKF